MTVHPKIGLDKLIFGMCMAEVRGVWGDPENIEHFIPLEDVPEDHSINWEYKSGVVASFDSLDGFALTNITVESNVVIFDGLPPVGLSLRELKLKFPTVVHDDEFVLAIEIYEFEEDEITFWLEGGQGHKLYNQPRV